MLFRIQTLEMESRRASTPRRAGQTDSSTSSELSDLKAEV
jgi:hypothetical protein